MEMVHYKGTVSLTELFGTTPNEARNVLVLSACQMNPFGMTFMHFRDLDFGPA